MRKFGLILVAALLAVSILSSVSMAIGPPYEIAKNYIIGKRFIANGVDTWRFVDSDGLAVLTTAGPLAFFSDGYDPRGGIITKRASAVWIDSEVPFFYAGYLENGNTIGTAGTTLMAAQDSVWGPVTSGLKQDNYDTANLYPCFTLISAEMDSLTTSCSDTAFVWVLYDKD